MKEEKKRDELVEKRDLSVPHLTNVNEDPILSGKIYHNLMKQNKLEIGRAFEQYKPDIILRGIGI